jgi:hypothetical protein
MRRAAAGADAAVRTPYRRAVAHCIPLAEPSRLWACRGPCSAVRRLAPLTIDLRKLFRAVLDAP